MCVYILHIYMCLYIYDTYTDEQGHDTATTPPGKISLPTIPLTDPSRKIYPSHLQNIEEKNKELYIRC